MTAQETEHEKFIIKDCALIAIATGIKAQNLKELRDQLLAVQEGSIYYHFWGGLLRPRFDDPEFKNDFSAWVAHVLHDKKLAEQLSVIDPTYFPDLEGLRQELVDVMEERLDEMSIPHWAESDQQFAFITSQIVVFDTNKRISRPEELSDALQNMSPSSVFYHFIDARRRTPEGCDDFRAWIRGFGDVYDDLCDSIGAVDPYFPTLSELRAQLIMILKKYFKSNRKRRAPAGKAPEKKGGDQS